MPGRHYQPAAVEKLAQPRRLDIGIERAKTLDLGVTRARHHGEDVFPGRELAGGVELEGPVHHLKSCRNPGSKSLAGLGVEEGSAKRVEADRGALAGARRALRRHADREGV